MLLKLLASVTANGEGLSSLLDLEVAYVGVKKYYN